MASGKPAIRMTVAAMVAVATLTFAGPAWAVEPGVGGWYWPLGHDHVSSGGSWLQYRAWYADKPAWHVAYDDVGTWKQPVYAAADGVVLESRMNVGGYGPGATAGGAMVVGYRTADGIDFKALYGHVEELRFSVGQNVRAGDVLCVLNNYAPPHVHFGIHLGTAYPTPSADDTATGYVGIMMGHSHESTVAPGGAVVPITYGWVDPVAFLSSHTPSAPPAPSLTMPRPPRKVRARRAFTVTGYLAPRHAVHDRTVVVEAYRLERGLWVSRARVLAYNTTSGSRTLYSARLRLTKRGTYLLRASVPGDAAHQAAVSPDCVFRVR